MRPEPDWHPFSPEVMRNPLDAYDDLRLRCPVAYSPELGWSFLRHQDVRNAALSPHVFSSVVSSYPAIPSGMDPPRHGRYRRLVEGYFTPHAIASFEADCRRLASQLVQQLPRRVTVDIMAALAHPFTLQAQCAFVGWPLEVARILGGWLARSQQATLAGDREATTCLAREFESLVDAQLEERRAAGSRAPDDPTTRLLREAIDGRPLSLEELTSILRNWTAGELATLAAAIGILVEFLARRNDLCNQLRRAPEQLPLFIEEVLRLHGPLVCNRRKLLQDAVIRGRRLRAGERVTLMWSAANRDETAFEASREFRLAREQSANLLWGAGIHICPGAALAKMELSVVLECLLSNLSDWRLCGSAPPSPATYPAAGFASLPLYIE